MYKSTRRLDPSDLPYPDYHLLPPEQDVDRMVKCTATQKVFAKSDCVKIDGKWVSKTHLGEMLNWTEEAEAFFSNIYEQISKAFDGDDQRTGKPGFDAGEFNFNLSSMLRALEILEQKANNLGGAK